MSGFAPRPTALALRYATFAVATTAVNVADSIRQQFTSTLAPTICTWAMMMRTLTRLIAKYLFDRRWIFREGPTSRGGHSRKFTLYSAMGVLTTCMFWGTESAA